MPADNRRPALLEGRLSWVAVGLVLGLILLNGYDISYHLISERSLSAHQSSEAILVATITALILLVFLQYRRNLHHADRELQHTRAEMQKAVAAAEASDQELERFREINRDIVASLRKAMEQQFDRWAFSPEEKRAARLLIQGLSFREVAARLDKSEKTIRNQSLSIYEKSGMTGRNDLAAFFLLDILDIDE